MQCRRRRRSGTNNKTTRTRKRVHVNSPTAHCLLLVVLPPPSFTHTLHSFVRPFSESGERKEKKRKSLESDEKEKKEERSEIPFRSTRDRESHRDDDDDDDVDDEIRLQCVYDDHEHHDEGCFVVAQVVSQVSQVREKIERERGASE